MSGTWRKLWPDLRPDLPRYLVAMACVPVISALGAAQPALMKRVLDDHVVAGSEAAGLWPAAMLYMAAVGGAFAVEAVYTIALSVAAENTIYRLRERIVRHTLGLSQRFFEGQPTGQVLTRATSDVEALSEALSQGSISLLLDVSNMAAVLLAMFYLDPHLTLALLALAPPLVAMIEFFRRRMRALFTEVRDALAALNTFTAERLAGVEVLQLYRQEARAQARFRALDTAHRNANVKNNVYDASLYALIDGISSICVALMIYWGARRIGVVDAGAQAVTVGLVVAFVDYIDRLFRPMREFSGKVTFLQRAGASLDKIFWLLGVQERITPGTQDLPVPAPGAPSGRLVLRDVRFAYKPGHDILHGIDLTVEPGEVVAVVGRTGSGKSTLVRLLARVHDGYRGSITIDGVELRELSPASVRRAIGSVRQEVQMFTDTLRFNLTLGEDVAPARLDAALALTNASVIVARHPEGLEQPIRERGANVSAGEAQILALARAMVRSPEIVILDEATASVDPLSERLLQEGIERVFAQKTCVVIAHRLSTIVHADRIVVLDAGRVIECGSHAELLAQGGAYAALYAEGFEAPTVNG